MRRNLRRGFSLVELLAVVLILAVLAALAVPLYLNTRKSAAARACKGNLAALAAAMSTKVLREGTYVPLASLVGTGPEGLAQTPVCPLDKDAYLIVDGTVTTGVSGSAITANQTTAITIGCPNFADHVLAIGGTPADYCKNFPAIVADSSTP